MKPKLKPPQPVRDLFEGPTPAAFVDLRNRPRRRGTGSNWSPNRQRLSEITNLIQHRHGGPCTTDDGHAYLTAALPALIEEAGGVAASECGTRIRAWATIALPMMASAEVAACIDEARKRNAGRNLHWKAQAIGDLLRLTIDERETLEIRMIRPSGMTASQFEGYVRAREAARKKAARAAAGARSQAESEARQKPWIALGISKSTYQRRKRAVVQTARDTTSSGLDTKYLQPRTERCHGADQTLAGPAMRLGGASHSVGADGHAPGARTRAVRQAQTAAPPFPDGEGWTQGDLLGDQQRIGSVAAGIAAILQNYEGGPMSPGQRQAARDLLRQMNLSHRQFGSLIGLSRQQVTNSLRPRGSDGFGREAAANMRRLLEVAA